MNRKAKDELEDEHRVIQQIVGGMAVLIERVDAGTEVHHSVFTDPSEFLKTFGETCHHGKEEDYLFKLFKKKGLPVSGCPLAVLVQEHEKGRKLLADLKLDIELYRRLPRDGREGLIETLRKLVELYQSQIWKEDYLLFPMAEKLLNESEQKELSAQFAKHETTIGADLHHGFEQLAGRILEIICGEATSCLAA
jgi:hemerythrin-like domain-containing protein